MNSLLIWEGYRTSKNSHVSLMFPITGAEDGRKTQAYSLFIVLTLIELHTDLDLVRDQILAGSYVWMNF